MCQESSLRPNDVLFDRGNFAKQHPGNQFYRELTKAVATLYRYYPKQHKKDISFLIYHVIHHLDGRFLEGPERNSTTFYQTLDLEPAMRKISQTIRDVVTKATDRTPPTTRVVPVEESEMDLHRLYAQAYSILQEVTLRHGKSFPNRIPDRVTDVDPNELGMNVDDVEEDMDMDMRCDGSSSSWETLDPNEVDQYLGTRDFSDLSLDFSALTSL